MDGTSTHRLRQSPVLAPREGRWVRYRSGRQAAIGTKRLVVRSSPVTAPEIHDARPVLLVRDIDATLSYHRDQLGFNTVAFGDPANFASASRGSATVLFALHNEPTEIVPNWRLRPQTGTSTSKSPTSMRSTTSSRTEEPRSTTASTTPHTASESSEHKTPMATTSPSASSSADVADGGSHVYGEDLPYLVGDRA